MTPNTPALNAPQRGIWTAEQLEQETPVFQIVQLMWTSTPLSQELFAQAARRVLAEAEVLRMAPAQQAGQHPVLVPQDRAEAVHADSEPLSDGAIRRRSAQQAARRARSADPYTAEFMLHQREGGGSCWALCVHHILLDAYGVGLITKRLAEVYTHLHRGEEVTPAWFSPAEPLADGAETEEVGTAELLARWQERLAPAEAETPLDYDPRRRLSGEVSTARRSLTEPLRQQIDELAERAGTSWSDAVTTAWAIFSAASDGRACAALRMFAMNRRGRAELTAPGMCAASVPVVLALDPQVSFVEALGTARRRLRAAVADAGAVGEEVIAPLWPHGAADYYALSQVNVKAFDYECRFGVAAGVQETLTSGPVGRRDLSLHRDSVHGFLCALSSSEPDASEQQLRVMLVEFEAFLQRLAAEPEAPLGSFDPVAGQHAAAETQQIPEGATVDSLLRAQAVRSPEARALVDDVSGDELTYAELDGRVNRWARLLVSCGAASGERVAVMVPRSPEMVVTLAAVLRAGAAYVPVDPEYPGQRVAEILQDSDARLLITAEGVRVPDGVPGIELLDIEDAETRRTVAAQSSQPVGAAERGGPIRSEDTACVLFTSGTTGRPKGVVISHRMVLNRLFWGEQTYPIDGSRTLLKTPVSFDVSVAEIFGALGFGGSLVVAAEGGHRDPGYLADVIACHRAERVNFVPSMAQAFLDHLARRPEAAEGVRELKWVGLAGEALPGSVARGMSEAVEGQVVNIYGPTEAGEITYHPCTGEDAETVVPVGRPISSARAYVLDAWLRPVPDGAAGELYLAGAQLADGYAGRPAGTAERFVPDSVAGDGSRMYRTGDLVRRNQAGVLEFLGRADDQVKIRGFRVEVEDVAAALDSHPAVGSSAVLAWDHPGGGGKLLIAYTTPSAGEVPDAEQLRAWAADRLPEHMVPAAVITLDELPVTTHGKLDRRRLPEPDLGRLSAGGRAPTGCWEQTVAAAFVHVLGLPEGTDVSAEDDFFALGGHSLLAARLVAQLAETADRDLSLRDVFDAPVVGRLAARLGRSSAAAGPRVGDGARPHEVPASYGQQSLLLSEQLDAMAFYRHGLLLSLPRSCDAETLGWVLEGLTARHEILRTRFLPTDSGWAQAIDPVEEASTPLTIMETASGSLREQARQLVKAPGDLAQEHGIRFALVRTAEGEDLLLVATHHAVTDEQSIAPMLRDLNALWTARTSGSEPGLPALEIQYADFVSWQNRLLGSPGDTTSAFGEGLSFWEQQLSGLPEETPLPLDAPREDVASRTRQEHRLQLGADAVGHLRALSERFALTPLQIISAALAAVLAGRGPDQGRSSIPLGLPAQLRDDPRLTDLIGYFVNTVVLRVDVSPEQPFHRLLEHTRDQMLQAEEHKLIPFEHVVDRLGTPRRTHLSPLFQVMTAYADERETPEPDPHAPIGLIGPWDLLTERGVRSPQDNVEAASEALYDVVFSVSAHQDGSMSLVLHTVRELFEPETAQRLLDEITALLTLGSRFPQLSVEQLGHIAALTRPEAPSPVRRSALRWTVPNPAEESGAELWGAAVTHLSLALLGSPDDVVLQSCTAERLTLETSSEVRGEEMEAMLRAGQKMVDLYRRGITARVRPPETGRPPELTDEQISAALDEECWDDWLEPLEEAAAPSAGPLAPASSGAEPHIGLGHMLLTDPAALQVGEESGRTRAQLAAAVGTALTEELEGLAGQDLILGFAEQNAAGTVHEFPGLLPARALAAAGEPQSLVEELAGSLAWEPRIAEIYPQTSQHPIFGEFFADVPAVSVRIALHCVRGLEGITALDAADPDSSQAPLQVSIYASEGSVPRLWVICRSRLAEGPDAGVLAQRIAEQLCRTGLSLPSAEPPAISVEPVALAPLPAAEAEAIRQKYGSGAQALPLTPLQRGLFYHMVRAKELGDRSTYVSQLRFHLAGQIDPARMDRAVQAALRRHPNAAAAFVSAQSTEVQVIPEHPRAPFELIPADPRSAVRTAAEEALEAHRCLPFDHERPPMVRFAAAETAPNSGEWLLAMTAEHILMDGASLNLLLAEVVEHYNGGLEHGLPPAASFPDYLEWLSGQNLEAAYRRWDDYLAGLEGPSMLWPSGGDLLGEQTQTRDLVTALEAEASDRLAAAAQQAGVTLSILLQTAWGITLGRLIGTADAVFGSTVSGRPADLPGADRIVGLLFNTLPMRVRTSPAETVRALLRRVQQEQAAVMDSPYAALHEVQRRSGHGTLFDTLFVVQNFAKPADRQAAALGAEHALQVTGVSVHDATHYPVTFAVHPATPQERSTHVRLSYRQDALAEHEAEALLSRYLKVLTGLAEHLDEPVGNISAGLPGDADPLSAAGEPAREIEPVTVHELLARQAAAAPAAGALVAGERRYSFAAFSEQVHRYARLLIARGVGPEHRVALLLPRDERMIIAMFAAFAAGAAYVPIDAEHPDGRIEYMLRTAEATVTLVTARDAHRLAEGSGGIVVDLDESGVRREIAAHSAGPIAEAERGGPVLPEHLAYIIFTSGSTGRPKGVAVNFRGLTTMFLNHAERIFQRVVEHQQGRQMRIAHTTSFSFDASWEQLFWMLHGHEVHVIDEEMRREPQRLLEHYDAERIDGFDVTPSYGQVLVDEGLLERDRPAGRSVDAEASGVVFVSLGGEAVPERLWSELRAAPGVEAYNLYGPTEHTINALGADLAESPTSSVGAPILNTRGYLLDESLLPVLPGAAGELYLAGDGTARGYWNQPGLTAERFVACPWEPGARMYRTGDLMRRTEKGLFDYLGRADDQVKIRGFRIEPGEVADVLAADPEVARAAVIPRQDHDGDLQLFGYLVPERGGAAELDVDAVRTRIRAVLPDYMVPAGMTAVEGIPLTVNGKTDARALPEITVGAAEHIEPRTEAEALLARTAAELLGLERVSAVGHFFSLGGNSLLAMRLIARVNEQLEEPLMVKDVFAAQTIDALAARIDDPGAPADPTKVVLVRLREAAAGENIFCAHARYGHATAYRALAEHVPAEYGIVGLQDPVHGGAETEFADFAELVSFYADAVEAAQPEGQLHLLGWSYGGHLCFALAQQLQRRGREVLTLTVVDTQPIPEGSTPEPDDVLPRPDVPLTQDLERQEQFLACAGEDLRRTAGIGAGDAAVGRQQDSLLDDPAQRRAFAVSGLRCEQMMAEPTRGRLQIPTLLVLASATASVGEQSWSAHLCELQTLILPEEDHYSVIDPERGLRRWGPQLRRALRAAQRQPAG
ncbi:amino acid adenylation domain-containing protein [Nesterenkonia populi]